jgi:hypothetical protein
LVYEQSFDAEIECLAEIPVVESFAEILAETESVVFG